jgi:hypothetical protein
MIAPNSNDEPIQTITIPSASLCTHPNIKDHWVWYNSTPDGHVQFCYDCQSELPDTFTSHTFSEMTLSEYLDWYFAEYDSDLDSETIAACSNALFCRYGRWLPLFGF